MVPTAKVNDVIKEFHGGHLGVTKTLKKLKQRFYWVGCQQAVADYIANCPQCITAKDSVRKSQGQFQKPSLPATQVSKSLYKNESSSEEKESLNKLHECVHQRMKARYDRAANCDGFTEGQLVLLFNPHRKIGLSPGQQTYWEGPYTVIKRINDVVYRIKECKSPRSKMKVVHLERLAAYGTTGESMPIRDEQA